MTTTNFYNQSSWIASYQVASTSELPNVAGAAIQSGAVTVNQLALVGGGSWYCCSDATVGAAKWFYVAQPPNPFIRTNPQSIAASALVQAGTTDLFVTNDSGTVYAVLGSVLNGFPIGTEFRVWKTSTSSNAIALVPDSGASINGGAADAPFSLPNSTTASSSSTSDASWIVARKGALEWRVTGGQPDNAVTIPEPLVLARSNYDGATGAAVANSFAVFNGMDIVFAAANVVATGIYTIAVSGADVPNNWFPFAFVADAGPTMTVNCIRSGSDIAVYVTDIAGLAISPVHFSVYLTRGAS